MPTDLTDVSDNIQNIINKISNTEVSLRLNLKSATADENLKHNIIDRLDELAIVKKELLNQLNPLYTTFQTNVTLSNDILNKQTLALDIINDESLNSDRQLGLLTTETRDKSRLVEINTYYGKQYNAHKQIMKTIVLICIPIIILTILGNKGLIPNTFVVLIITFIIIFGIFSIGYQIIDLSNRDKMNYDEYDWKFNKNSAPGPNDSTSMNINDPWSINYGTCIGSSCCATVEAYNENKKKCCNSGFKYNATTLACDAEVIRP